MMRCRLLEQESEANAHKRHKSGEIFMPRDNIPHLPSQTSREKDCRRPFKMLLLH